MFHVSSRVNRGSISSHGLDWTRMADAPGIAGSETPEQEGCFLCRGEPELEFIVGLNNTGGPVDVWAVDGIDEADLVRSPEGYLYLPRRIPSRSLTLLRRDIPPPAR